jgi:hypothetical protein
MKFTDSRGVKYQIDAKASGKFQLWSWSNKQSGWKFNGEFSTYQEAYDLMLSIGLFK